MDAGTTVVQGTMDLLVLKVLSLEPMHGWGISERIATFSGEAFRVNQGSLYLALERLQGRGLVSSAWQTTENNRRARYYSLTRSGRRQFEHEQRAWRRAAAGIELVLQTATGRS
jgi:PadR family transcriptional regulator PadR